MSVNCLSSVSFYIQKPFFESKHQWQLAFNKSELDDIDMSMSHSEMLYEKLSSLLGRVAHFTAAVALAIPVLGTITYLALSSLGMVYIQQSRNLSIEELDAALAEDSSLINSLDQYSSLHERHVDRYTFVSGDREVERLFCSMNLKKLVVTSDDYIENLSYMCPNLEVLDISGIRDINEYEHESWLLSALEGLKNLKKLILGDLVTLDDFGDRLAVYLPNCEIG